MDLEAITDRLIDDLRPLRFGPPVSHVYNPLEYAREPYRQYLQRYAKPRREAVFIGMNPGPWGMAQTGIPFGEITAVTQWLGITATVGKPQKMHPKRPVEGFACRRREVSGRRLWGWAQDNFKTPRRFFARFFVANYCPLLFIDTDGRNRTPNRLRSTERSPLLAACDRALRHTIGQMQPRWVIGIGRFTEQRARIALGGLNVKVGAITHPSPANPKANRGWDSLVRRELASLGIRWG